MNKLEILKKRLLYRSSYRGTKEMDLLLGSFVKFYINKLTVDELYELDKFLDFDDERIHNWYLRNDPDDILKKNKFSHLLKKYKV